MMIPPLIRQGPVPPKPNARYAVLHREFGWVIVTKAAAEGYFYRFDDQGQRSPVHQDNIVCWMPQDGS